MAMDVHARYRTEAHQDVVPRFNERFLRSLVACDNVLFMDDRWNVLPVSSRTLHVEPVPPRPLDNPLTVEELELKSIQEKVAGTEPVATLLNCCCTVDQANAVARFISSIAEKTLRSTVVMTAARGRGKSAALGLAMAGAVAFGYCNIFVTAPSPENLDAMFEFIFKGFDALHYQEHLDYEVVQSTNPEFHKATVRINIFREHRQTIQYIHPSDYQKLGQAELVCIDEAAAIPLPLVKNLLGPYLVFMSSTINGYEGTGRSLSLKLVSELRKASNTTVGPMVDLERVVVKKGQKTQPTTSIAGKVLHEVTLRSSIRYASGDRVEQWLNDLLCLDVGDVPRLIAGCPDSKRCELYYVNRDTLFSYNPAAETFLKRLVSLYVASHYKNSPNDLQMLSDAPAHHIFCLVAPSNTETNLIPEILCVIQICLEGEISKQIITNGLKRGKRASGDLIPWTVSQQFMDDEFGTLSGARIVRIATHPDFQRMGYGRRAMELLQQYFEGQMPCLTEDEVQSTMEVPTVNEKSVSLLEERIAPRKNLAPLLVNLSHRPPERLDYLGVSYGLTSDLLMFWKRLQFTPVYLRQTANDLTGEHSCIMLKELNRSEDDPVDKKNSWLSAYWNDFRRRFVSLLSYQFRAWRTALALNVLDQKQFRDKPHDLSRVELDMFLTAYDRKRLEGYSSNMSDYHSIMDLVPTIARLYFLNRIDVSLRPTQAAILLGIGLQHKMVEDIADELSIADKVNVSQVLAFFNQSMRSINERFFHIKSDEIERNTDVREIVLASPIVAKSFEDDIDTRLGDQMKEKKRKHEKHHGKEHQAGKAKKHKL